MLLSRQQTEFYLTDLETPVGKAINLVIAGLVLLSSGIFVAETYNIPDTVRFQLDLIDTTILAIFAVEYVIRLWSAENKIKYIFSFYAIIDLMAMLPYF